jgi:hypothetical protein
MNLIITIVAFFIVTGVKSSNLTQELGFHIPEAGILLSHGREKCNIICLLNIFMKWTFACTFQNVITLPSNLLGSSHHCFMQYIKRFTEL